MAALKGTILLTGANGALGDAIVAVIISTAELAAYHCIYTVRNALTATALQATLANAPVSHSYEIISLDVSNLTSVRQVATTISGRVAAGEIPPIRALMLTAGYIEYHGQRWTDDGLDMSFASNYLGHWLLSLMLLQSMDRDVGRIVVLSSWSYE
jgi:NAD(P)-dependent dehydrogenase (short-subunit alcohol dehydrogenase family)